MLTLFRLLAVLLVLTTGGVFQTLAYAAGTTSACEEEADEEQHCTDCTASCGLCVRCPQPASPGMEVLLPVPPVLVSEPAPTDVVPPVLSPPLTDVFQPPRA
ncbi:hypothetical protein D7X30_08325 [Corallococcus sp. AB011P]|uniref:hypothetical protein n=1 Tax=Corallococcus sp. AB011P TaxID=2316735 RepID=UPI000EA32424|nr:hypothetical protein [Corallococcus sp. AB011P]RKG60902.1 hypothetical protein D7X30_08325 [Corallococcus sp. AB011P]